jgi:hypothetical protein
MLQINPLSLLDTSRSGDRPALNPEIPSTLASFESQLSDLQATVQQQFEAVQQEMRSSAATAAVAPPASNASASSTPPSAVSPTGDSAPPSSESSAAKPSTGAKDPGAAFDAAYWARQPKAVQALEKIQDPDKRMAMASQLASEGYTIDVPIMAWGWDAYKTTMLRNGFGYTWVPSATQAPVEVAPGLPAMGTLQAYDPNNPPPGSIRVPNLGIQS